MARYIKESELLETIDKLQKSLSPRLDARDNIVFDALEIVNSLIEKQPTADVAEVVHGYWKDSYGFQEELDKNGRVLNMVYCSICGEYLEGSSEYSVIGFYCPNCGAKMDGKKVE